MKPLVIYHANCTDGFGAAFAAWLKLGDEVLQIRNSPLSGKILSQIYGVPPGHISNIRNGNSWKNE